ncbi:MAG: lytic murein transglycosylase [bacterium]|nr:lytic murein transglycosylase [bacterium]
MSFSKKLHKSPFGLGSGLVSLLVLFILFLGTAGPRTAEAQEITPEKRVELEQRLGQLEKETEDLDGQLQKILSESRSLASETKALETEVRKKEVEIKRINLALSKTELEIRAKTKNIEILKIKIEKNQKALGASLFLLYAYEQDDMVINLIKNKSLSDFLSNIYNLEKTQADIEDNLKEFKDDRITFEKEKEDLEGFREDQQDLKALQEIEKRVLAQKKKEKDEILRLTKGKESIFQDLLKTKRKDIASLRGQLFYLEKTGISAEDALKFAESAAKRAGIRPAFLLALLEVETGKRFEGGKITAGSNVGTGNWKKDLYDCYVRLGKKQTAESEKSAFFKITSSLGLDPDSMPVSRKPNYGCGGAMGPAQFLPTTWLSYQNKVIELLGRSVANPWKVEDAFTAAAVLLADSGADSQTTEGEIRAAKVYISGKPNCTKSICKWYSSQIIALSRDIDRVL